MAVVEPAADPLPVAVEDVHDATPAGCRVAGFSTIFWKIHGCDERRSIFSVTTGSGVSEVSINT